MLADRRSECARLDQLLAEAQLGQSASLVLRGEAGIGKSALLDYVAERSAGRVLRATGAQWEMELPFAGVHQLCRGLLGGRERLPQPQSDAVATAFGLSSGPQPDRFLVGLAVLGLLAHAAEEQPLVCVVDDAQWLDQSSLEVFSFVARRLGADAVLFLFAERDPGRLAQLAGLPELGLEGLPDDHAHELLASVVSSPLDRSVLARILAESRGNPLALLELPRGSSPGALAGGFGFPADASLPDQIEASFERRVQQLPGPTQRLLLLAAAEPTGEPGLLVRAAAEVGISTDELRPAQADGLLDLGRQVTFRHPLLRSAIYTKASIEERRAAHLALAAATDAELDPDRRAWHRAHAAAGPDEDIAAELEQSAGRASARGGLAASAAFMERAVALTPDRQARARRALEAAATKYRAGDPQSALSLVATAAGEPLGAADEAMVKRLNGQILLDLGRSAEALPDLMEAAKQLEAIDPGAARETHMEALRAACFAGRFGPGVRGPAEAARRAPPRAGAKRLGDLLLDALAIRFTDGYVAAAPALKDVLAVARDEERAEWESGGPWLLALPLTRFASRDLMADDLMRDIAVQGVDLTRDKGALAMLTLALSSVAYVRILEGDLRGATVLLDEADANSAATGTEPLLHGYGRAFLVGYRGNEDEALALWNLVEPAATERGVGMVVTLCEHARAVLYNGLGRYDEAFGPARSAVDQDELFASTWALPELVEAAARCDRTDTAREALETLCERTRAAGTNWALGIEARSRGLLSDGDVAEQSYREAIDHLARTSVAFELARARLLYGEWLRREQRRVDAREQLRVANEAFTSMGAEAFASRSERELQATGETARKRTEETRDDLTAQETQIAQLAREGFSNPEIGARLFISPRTVEYHLHKVFVKLGISRREQLNRVLSD